MLIAKFTFKVGNPYSPTKNFMNLLIFIVSTSDQSGKGKDVSPLTPLLISLSLPV